MLNLLSAIVWRTRQHHGLEHATLHLLARRIPDLRMVGLSDPLGFTLYGKAEQEQVQHAVIDAMLRLQSGEHALAIHPNCGTNLATTGVLVTLAAMAARPGNRSIPEQIARTLLLVLGALVAAVPLGHRVQAYTTTGNLSGRWLVGVRTLRLGPLAIHRIMLD